MNSAPNNCQIAVVFRYDDYHARRGAQDTRKLAIERRAFEAFAAQRVPLTVGVAPHMCEDYCRPDNDRFYDLEQDGERLRTLTEFVRGGMVEPALHGWDHQDAKRSARASEFAGLAVDAQTQRLRAGKQALEGLLGTDVHTVIPPWNTYDAATVQAAEATGLSCIANSPMGPAVRSGLGFVPQTCSLGELARVLDRLAQRPGRWLVGTLFHHFSFFESDDPLARAYASLSLSALDGLLQRCAQDPAVVALTTHQLRRQVLDHLPVQPWAAFAAFSDRCRRRALLSQAPVIGHRLADWIRPRAWRLPSALEQTRRPMAHACDHCHSRI